MLKTLWGRFARGNAVALPDDLWDEAVASLPFVSRLPLEDRSRLRTLAAQFLPAKEMAGAAGLDLTAEIQLNIAVQACLPVLNLGLDWYRGWNSIVVYPGEFLVPRSVTDDDGVVHEYTEPIAGEAWDGGPLLLSWEDTRAAGADDGAAYSVVIHEFTHKIDLLNGDADGVPPFSPALHAGLDPRSMAAGARRCLPAIRGRTRVDRTRVAAKRRSGFDRGRSLLRASAARRLCGAGSG